MAPDLEGLGNLVPQVILPKLDPRSAAVFACVSSRCRAAASDDALWREFCSRELDLHSPLDPDGNPCPSFKVAYQMWQESFGMYPWSLVRRVKKCWTKIKNWMTSDFPEATSTLQAGVSEAEIKEFEDKLGIKLPLPTRVLYRFCDGQNTLTNYTPINSHLATMGLIGGYIFYDHLVNVHLLPLSLVIEETREFASLLGSFMGSDYVVVAVSCYVEKLFLLHCTTGQLYVGTKNLRSSGEMLPCVPGDLVRLVPDSNNDLQDAMLLWLEEHASRLQDGRIQVRNFDERRRIITLFPERPCSTAVTHGVQVRASAVFVPELCDLNNNSEKFWFSYSIRMRLLPEGCLLDGMYFSSVQLLSRHWIICASENVVSDVSAEAVIGKFPLLVANKPEFVYESCTPLPSSPGSVEGSFTFVPGRLRSPEGRQFEAEVARFVLEVPSYIF